MWVLDMDPYINDYTSSFFLFDILMNGSYFSDKNVYLVENEAEEKMETYSVNTMSSEAHSSARNDNLS